MGGGEGEEAYGKIKGERGVLDTLNKAFGGGKWLDIGCLYNRYILGLGNAIIHCINRATESSSYL